MKKTHFFRFIGGVLAVSLTLCPCGCAGKGDDNVDASGIDNLPEDAVYDDFSSDTLNTEIWLEDEHNWGGYEYDELGAVIGDYNGGVVTENISVSNGKLVLTAHGDLYEGDVLGICRDGTARENGKRVGACVKTKEWYASGSYEVRAKICPELGACSAFWTYEYEWEEATQHEVNHEIDIEFPGRPDATQLKDWDFQHVLLTTWEGVLENEYNSTILDTGINYADGEYHTFRFDWHTGDEEKGEYKRVEYYFDGELIYTSYDNVPTNESQFWVGVWFPNKWAGSPDFDTSCMEVDYVKIVPFHESGDTPHK